MKTKGSVFILLLCVCASLLAFINSHAFDELALNSAIPVSDVKMKDVGGTSVSLADAKKSSGLLVVFSCNTCPYVRMTEKRIKEYSDMALAGNIGCILVNSNEAQRNEEDSFAEMVKYYNNLGLKCYYTVDEHSKVANGFGAGHTPQCFLFNKDGKLVYKGAIDDNVKDASQVKTPYLKDALTAVMKNELPKIQETKSLGCTIKRAD